MPRGLKEIGLVALAFAAAITIAGCSSPAATQRLSLDTPGPAGGGPPPAVASAAAAPSLPERESARARQVALAAMGQVGKTVSYDPSYVPLSYPGGDVPLATGVCSDVVIRAYRAVGVDLQVEVHKDMLANFSAYPQKWGLSRPDPSIDQRRVPNLQTYFKRHGASRAVTKSGADYWPGDVVVWSVNGLPHSGVVSDQVSPDGTHFMIAHNIGAGAQIEDLLFAYPIAGHYRSF